MRKKGIKKWTLSMAAVAILITTFVLSVFPSKGAEIIHEETNPELKFKVYDTNSGTGRGDWKAQGKFTQYDGNKYNIDTNAYCMWWGEDDISYAYQNYTAAYGDKGTIAIEVTILNSQLSKGDTFSDVASTGIALRNGDSADTASVYLHCRPDWVGIVYRAADGKQTILCDDGGPKPTYPIRLKMEKTGNMVKCAYMTYDSTNGKWTETWDYLKTCYVKMDDTVMAGIAAHNGVDGSWMSTDFKDFKVTISGPEGSKYESPEGGNTGDEDEEEEINPIPPDSPLTDNILFRETFSDGSLVNPTETGDNEISNPIWSSETGDPENANIVTEGSNRYWHRAFTTDDYFFEYSDWTDYSLSMDLKFGKDTIPEEINRINMYVRYRALDAYGYFGYRVELSYGYNLKIYKCIYYNPTSSGTLIAEVKLDETYLNQEDWTTWRVEAFDNIITVFRDDKELLSVQDNALSGIGKSGGAIERTEGGIGFGSEAADVCVDNIIVRKMYDPLGGDYDNHICGNYDQDTPEYLKTYEGAY